MCDPHADVPNPPTTQIGSASAFTGGAQYVDRPRGGRDSAEVGVPGQVAPTGQVERRGRVGGDQVDGRSPGGLDPVHWLENTNG
jgi:hypothetical protein